MPSFTLSDVIHASPAVVFDTFTNLDRATERVPSIVRIERLTPGAFGLGTKFRETRVVFKREASETFEVTAFEPNQMFELTARSCGAMYQTQFRFAPTDAGTRVDVAMTIRAESFLAKLFTPLSRMMMGMVKKCVAADVVALKKVAETAV